MSRTHHTDFDPSGAATGEGIFGLPVDPDTAAIHLLGVPFDATCSGRRGTAGGPAAIAEASHQVDLLDSDFGSVFDAGIHLDAISQDIRDWSEYASWEARKVIARGGAATASLAEAARVVDALSARRTDEVARWTRARLDAGCIPGIIGGDHSCPLGAIREAAAAGPLSILHIDAHHDLRAHYQGFDESHASIMHNVLAACGDAVRIVQVGIRDYCAHEVERADESERVIVHYWKSDTRRLLAGEPWTKVAGEIIDALGDRVWISFDADGLDPSLCPNTGTPVPGGLSFDQAAFLLTMLGEARCSVAGFDLCEVAADEFDANVGARLLYKLCGTCQ